MKEGSKQMKILTSILIGLFIFSFISYGYSYGLTTDNNDAINKAEIRKPQVDFWKAE